MSKNPLKVLGVVSYGLIVALIASSFEFRCVHAAVEIGVASAVDGTALGVALAFVTWSRRPIFIYVWLAAAIMTFVPQVYGWPEADADLSERADLYLTALRLAVFLLAFPFPFARIGRHGPDPR
jgi:hypothetical protein